MNENTNYTVYVHAFPDGKYYVGLTKQNVQTRWGFEGNGYKSQPVYEAIQKYGWNNIDHIIINENLTYKEAQKLEKEKIIEFDSINNGYNQNPGGGLGGNSWRTIMYNGKEYTVEEILQFSTVDNLTAHDVTTRMSHGWNVNDILNKPKTNRNVKYEYEGELYSAKELAQISKIKDLTYSDILNRINNLGWSVERAITQPKNVKMQPYGCRDKEREFTIQYNNVTYTSHDLELLSNVSGLTAGNIVNRINENGWSVEDAINKPKKGRNIKFELDGKLYTSKELADMSPYDNITYHDITDRIRAGWTVHDAVYRKKRKSPKPKLSANQQLNQTNPDISSLGSSETNF